MSDLHKRLEFAKALCLPAGEIMLKHFKIGIAKEDKADGSPVTIADKEINSMVIEAINEKYPSESLFGEEESVIKEGAEYLWMCDPIDGTIPYTCGIPTNVFTLALLQDGQPLLAVVYDPYLKRLFTAIKGEGAFCNDKPIQVSKNLDLKQCKVTTTGRLTNKNFDALSFRAELQNHVAREPQFLSFSYEGMMVAAGQFDAAIFPGVVEHDVGPLRVIIEEAGGKVTDLAGNDQRYDQPINGAILSNGLIHEELVALVKPFLTT